MTEPTQARDRTRAGSIHPRISVENQIFPPGSAPEHIALWEAVGARHVGVGVPLLSGGLDELDRLVPLLAASGFSVATIMHPFLFGRSLERVDAWAGANTEIGRVLAAASTVKAESVYILTGGRGALSWEEAATAFSAAIAPSVAAARRAGIPLLIETASPLYADLHIAHSLNDTVRLADQAGVGVCIDIFACWAEAGLQETIARAMPHCALVQVADWVAGDRSIPCRAVPGDGCIPLERILGWILENGYDGSFGLEIQGARTYAEGGVAASSRAADWLGETLVRLGA